MTDLLVRPRFSPPVALFWLFRPGRTFMMAIVAGTAAFAAGAGIGKSFWMALTGWCLAVGGFSMDFYADRHVDRRGTQAGTCPASLANPLADGSLPARFGLVFSLGFLAASLAGVILLAPWGLLPWTGVVIVVAGLAVGIFDKPLLRAATLGLLQALYLLLGGTAGSLNPGFWILAGVLLFAMTGARGMTDIRDFPEDKETRVQTLPKRYGAKRTVVFTLVCLHIAYALSLAAYFTGSFSRLYLYVDIAFIGTGLILTWYFAARPTPRAAHSLTPAFLMGQGSLFSLMLVLGTLGHT
ncbi:MAG: UbiA family prenyltransferase [candidate division WOR-3 bacterium]|nr:MAG: UbiA family prenyltransferase [candidate division WOR-3 bacterium]